MKLETTHIKSRRKELIYRLRDNVEYKIEFQLSFLQKLKKDHAYLQLQTIRAQTVPSYINIIHFFGYTVNL